MVWIDDTQVASTIEGAPAKPPKGKSGDISVGGDDFRYATFGAPGMLGSRIRVAVLAPKAETTGQVAKSRIIAGGILAGFFILAVTFAFAVSRSLRGQVMELLDAARRLGRGDFTTRVPAVGGDEFAALGEEFNRMAQQLEERLADLAQERERVQNSMRRLGQAVGSNLDRDALLQLVVQTAVEGVGGEAGRATVRPRRDAPLEERVRVGGINGLTDALREAEARALRSGKAEEAAVGDGCALAHPLSGSDTREGVVGLVSVGRSGRAFTAGERDLFHYLATQAGVSMENVGLHETVARESVTDELTGLFNRRRFDEVLDTEVERAKRFGQPMALVLLDIDDFKQVNDTYGHQQGDVVLREVGRVLRESCREIDEPARYGGEELAVVLPGTDLHGAYLLAERVRQGVESLKLPLMVARGRHPGHGQSWRGGAPRVRRRPGRARRSGRCGHVRREARRKESRDAGSARPLALTPALSCGPYGPAGRRHSRAPRAQAAPRSRSGRGRAPGERGARSCPPHRGDGAGAARGRARA